MTHFYIGCELGKSQMTDYTALAIIERLQETETLPRSPYDDGAFPPIEVPKGPVIQHGRHLHRYPLGTRYPALIEHLQGVLDTPPLKDNCTVIVNVTDAGAPVMEMLRNHNIRHHAVIITGGQLVAYEGGITKIPKRVLVSTLQVLLQSERLKFANSLPEAPTLISELLNFQLTQRESEADIYEGRQGPTADLVLAVALACYQAERPVFTPIGC